MDLWVGRSLCLDMQNENKQKGCQISETFQTYISKTRDYLKNRCSKLTECIDTILGKENFISIIKGENISINKTCGLIYNPENGRQATLQGECSVRERDDIRSNLEKELDRKLANDNTWRSVKHCLGNNVPRTTRVEEICLMARQKSEICSTKSHSIVQNFFNAEMLTWRCACKSIAEPDHQMADEAIVGIGVGCFLAIVTIFSLLFFGLRRIYNKKKTKSRVHRLGESKVTSSQTMHVEGPRVCYQQRPSSQPGSMFSQFIHLELANQGELTMDFMKYRPVPPIPNQTSGDAFESPPRYSDHAVYEAESPYFEPIPEPAVDFDDSVSSSYAEQTRNNALGGVEGELTSGPVPSDVELVASIIPSRPIPTKRTNKTESYYFELDAETIISEN